MDFRLFGPFEVWHDGATVDPGDLQQRYVLVILLLNANRAVTREYLQEYVWRGQEQPRSDLITSYIARLRKVFKDSPEVVIDKTPTGYLLRLDENLIDVVRFRTLCARARTANDAATFHEALDLWRGRFLSDMDVDRVGGPTVMPSEEERVDALVDLAELELSAGQHRRIRDRLRPVWEEDRSQQRIAAALMRALIQSGDHVRAVEVYHQTRDALDEYGMDVSRELRDTMRRAQYGDRLSSLPMRQNRFTGRADELAFVDSVARSAVEDGPSVLWISGMPGVGKTALAVSAAHRLGDVFPDGRLFVDLTGFTPNVAPATPAAALARLLTDLGVPPEAIPENTAARADLYRSTVDGTRTLVVLDNAASEEQVEPLLGGTLTLITSREQGALMATEHIRLEPLPPHEAVELFRKLVTAERVHGHVDQIREVVALCGQVPLLIHLVAAQFQRHTRWPLTHLLDLLREVPAVSPDTTFPHAATMACTVSYDQLTEEQQTLFRVFALAPGADLSAPGAAALMGIRKARGLLEDLHRVSLLEESAPERFQMLDPLRDYVLAAHPPEDPVTPVDRLLDFYLATTAVAVATVFPFDRDRQPEPTVTSPVALSFRDGDSAMDWLDDERYNLVAAVSHAAAHDRPEHAWRLAVLLWRYLYVRGHLREWTDTLQRAADVLDGNTMGLANVRLRLSEARRNSGALTEARALAEQALPLWVELRDVRGEATTLVAIATNAYMIGDFPAAAEHLTTALDRWEKTGDASGHAHALDLFGLVSERRGDLIDAERKHLAAIELLRRIDHRPGLAHSLDNLGYVRQRLGRLDDALAHHTEARELAVELGDPGAEAYALNNLGNTHRLAGRYEEAMACQQQARNLADLVVDPNLRTQLYLDRGETARAVGDHQAALHAYRAALDLSAGMGERVQRARATHRIAEVLHDTGRHDPAHWHDALSEFAELGLPEADEVRAELDKLTCACAG
ncbi:AfsR/SARP family transcriptional regulator [Actinophytocola algeriensis]|uniref:DNA-binding SARP family transcriptional activator/tetratricopeptide (TPR) repeat protein n=1 Tax=Actinophytocola algeriensis TaxID=1768010 RepID=A0A7W7VE81_9PSEU|nr:tetratricopeptide repeat protein [Actinophytocola algeriensis]MBB4906988.1 DNA-binding SARP family transcriptional activator/tetratricopeptide (TPR) repeat protein [Actinophytocola algeriensis]MBE1478471.1 DNA-binding SARP family transcriptional activator/tetratricopeptide (TPR) repeat protein [Actinophytocola algeriensis]